MRFGKSDAALPPDRVARLLQYLDRCPFVRRVPDLVDFGVADGYAPCCPIPRTKIAITVPSIRRLTVNHDQATRTTSILPRFGDIECARVGNMDCSIKAAGGVLAVEHVETFRRAPVAVEDLVPARLRTECDAVGGDHFFVADQVKPPLALDHQHAVDFPGAGEVAA